MQVSTRNGSASGVSVALTSQPSSQKPTFTRGCAKGEGTVACAVGSVSGKQPTILDAQIPVTSGATAVKLTATANVTTSANWTPPSATATVTVIRAASASPAQVQPAAGAPGASLPLGPIPDLNGAASSITSNSVVGAGDASGLFPAIGPSAAPEPAPGVQPNGGKRDGQPQPVADSSTLTIEKPGLSAQVAGLIALAVAVLLAVTRLSFLKRLRSRKQGN